MAKYIVSKVLHLSVLKDIKEGTTDKIGAVNFLYDYEKIKTFQRSCTCINCGLKAHEVRIEKMKNCKHPVYGQNHVNLYGYTHKGREVLFTVDHNILKSKGGPDVTENYNTMCERCNRMRGSKFEKLDDFLDKYKNVSTEEFWDGIEAFEAYQVQQKRERNLRKIDENKKWKENFLLTSMHHHVGLYNRHMKKLQKELDAAK